MREQHLSCDAPGNQPTEYLRGRGGLRENAAPAERISAGLRLFPVRVLPDEQPYASAAEAGRGTDGKDFPQAGRKLRVLVQHKIRPLRAFISGSLQERAGENGWILSDRDPLYPPEPGKSRKMPAAGGIPLQQLFRLFYQRDDRQRADFDPGGEGSFFPIPRRKKPGCLYGYGGKAPPTDDR